MKWLMFSFIYLMKKEIEFAIIGRMLKSVKPEFCVGIVEEAYQAGFVSLKIYIHNVTDKGEFD